MRRPRQNNSKYKKCPVYVSICSKQHLRFNSLKLRNTETEVKKSVHIVVFVNEPLNSLDSISYFGLNLNNSYVYFYVFQFQRFWHFTKCEERRIPNIGKRLRWRVLRK